MRWFVLLVLACGPVGGGQTPPPTPKRSPPDAGVVVDAGTTQTGGADEKLTGAITQIDFGCARDASCDLTLDGKNHVHFGHDTRGERPHRDFGKVDEALWAGMQDSKAILGKRVEVFAARIEAGSYTIQGNAAYYIKLVP